MNIKLLEYFKGDELAASTWLNKYAAKGEETPDDTHKRVAKEFYRIEYNYSLKEVNKDLLSDYGQTRKALTEEDIYNFFKGFKYIIPGGSVLAGAGTGELVSLSNCFVIDSPKDSYDSIMNTRNYQVQLMKRRGGVGYDLSNLRPKGAVVNNAAKTSTGAASFMEVCSDITNEVAQNGRRGALMLSMSINHPDIEEFITKKQDLTKVTGANISVKVTDNFMKAVIEDKDYILRYPVDNFWYDHMDENDFHKFPYGELQISIDSNDKVDGYFKRIKARELWDTLMYCAWNTAEPGIMFEDTMHDYSPDGIYDNFKMISTNPCGEIPMGPNDSCRLIHLNLTSFVEKPFTTESKFDLDKFYNITYEATRLADDLVDLEIEAVNNILNSLKEHDNTEKELWSKIKETAIQGRRAGLGFTGLADTIAMLGLKYDSKESLVAIELIMSTMFKAQLDSSLDMAIERGKYPACDLDEKPLTKWYAVIQNRYPNEYNKLIHYGIRNISWSTVAPTGTISIMAGVSSGIEPVFMPFYERKRKCMSENDKVDYVDKIGDKYTVFVVVHPMLKRFALEHLNYTEDDIANWDIKAWNTVFHNSPWYKSTASDIDWRKRVQLQGIVQKYITHSISSTINLPKETTKEEIADIYIEAWKYGNKGQTIYRDGCREGVLNKIDSPKTIGDRQAPKRPKVLEANYYQVKVKGEQFIILIGLLDGKPYEVFAFRPLKPVNIEEHSGVITKKGKMCYSFDSEHIQISNLELANSNIEEKAATLYASMLLRHGIDIKHIVKIVKKVNDNIISFSSALCRILSKYIIDKSVKESCPNCGGTLVREGGCIRCLDCDYSKCL